MFLGTFANNLDAKNRLSLPKKIAVMLSGTIVVSKGFDGCLELRTYEAFQAYSDKLMNLSQNKKNTRIIQRQLLANAAMIDVDSNNRILLPTNLLKEAKITKSLVLIGVGTKLEIWDSEQYSSFKESTDATYEKIAEELEDENF